MGDGIQIWIKWSSFIWNYSVLLQDLILHPPRRFCKYVANLNLRSLEKAMTFSTQTKNSRTTMENDRGRNQMNQRIDRLGWI